MVERHHQQLGRPEELTCLSSVSSVIKQFKVDPHSSCKHLGNKIAPGMCRLDFEKIGRKEEEETRRLGQGDLLAKRQLCPGT
jgi:hypothetical protein